MPVDLRPAPDVPVTELVSGIVGDVQELVSQQFQLFKHDLRKDLRDCAVAVALLAAGGAIGLVAAVLLGIMVAYLINWAWPNVPLWEAFGIVTVVAAVGAGLTINAGRRMFATMTPVSPATAEALKENIELLTHPQ